ncbi:DUF4382 domain-containing protein [Vibrio sp. ZSDE26]|uniref:DUF4382 domain-containing protein n=1 Tax=Vibrio amylolyticus TaxID=2847292 RepID=A0A9X1XLQ7_9VIBR|nr:DUF4382 domain-containing protein [Vibrio amylolyticus]MCK6264028.1 DUF4382 domain-containing protein [Vibrio amylolyticus]
MCAIRLAIYFFLSLLIVSCGGGGSGGSASSQNSASVSFSVSDAPVDSAQEVMIAFEQIELVVDDDNSAIIDVNDGQNDYVQVNLLDYQGTDALLIVSDESIPVGRYENLILHISDESGVNYVLNNNAQHELKQPSNKLKLGEFEVTTEAVQSFTIEFDLRMSLVLRGNQGNNNGYILKPHGVSIVGNDEAVSLSGTVETNLFDEGTCDGDDTSMVYLYEGSGLDSTLLIDLVDTDDEEFSGDPVIPDGSIEPVASAEVGESGTYQFGYLTAGEYTVAFACDGEEDDSIEYDPEIIIPMAPTVDYPDDKYAEVTLVQGVEGVVNFLN